MDIDTTPCQAQIALAIDDQCGDPIGALENVLGIIRRTGLVLQRMTMRRGGGNGASLLLDVQALDPGLLRLVIARLENSLDIADTACTVTSPRGDIAEIETEMEADKVRADEALTEPLAA